MVKTLSFTIPVAPVTKKNSQRMVRVKSGRVIPLPSKAYTDYEKASGSYIPFVSKPISWAVNIKAIYYMKTRRIVDLVNLNEALCDVLTHYNIIQDDNSRIVASMDGCRVRHDKDNPRTEVIISWDELAQIEAEK